MIEILIADDHPILREGIKAILSPVKEMIVVAEANDGDQAWSLIHKVSWNFLLLDLAMPGKSVLDIIKHTKQQYPQRPILILSGYEENEYAMRAFRAGADGYLSKNLASTHLIKAIQKLAKGGKFISHALAEQLIDELNPNIPKGLHRNLTNREFQVFCGLAQGKGLTDIANELNLSVKTISTFRARLMKKMQMTKNAEIIHYALKYKLTI